MTQSIYTHHCSVCFMFKEQIKLMTCSNASEFAHTLSEDEKLQNITYNFSRLWKEEKNQYAFAQHTLFKGSLFQRKFIDLMHCGCNAKEGSQQALYECFYKAGIIKEPHNDE